MTTEQGVDIVDFLVSQNPAAKELHICFFGGEPMLQFNIMREVVNIIKKKYPDIVFKCSITTNGTIVSKEIIDFLKTHKFSLLVSFDGPDIISNNRPYKDGTSSTSKVLNNIKSLRSENIPIIIRATIASNSNKILETFQFLEQVQVPFEFAFAYSSANKSHNLSNYTFEELSSIDKQMHNVINYYYDMIYKGKMIYCQTIIDKLSDIHFKILSKTACQAGFSSLSFNADGTIFTCQHFANNKNDSCGSIQDGIYEDKAQKLRAPNIEEITECSSCWCRYLCGGCCFAEKYSKTGSVIKNIPEKCELEKIKWEKILILSQMLWEKHPEYLAKLKQKYNENCM
jgi:uncharacterized protein